MSLSAGSRLGPYEIAAAIGAGGMGEVYRAKDTRLDRTVAVKVLPAHLSSSAESRQRFEREAKTISQLSHPHICALYDVGSEGETEYLVMEYLEGQTLAERLVNGALPLEQTLRYGQEIADALDKAHRQGIVHRDLKPANVMITKSGVKLLDFGLAKALPSPGGRGVGGEGITALPTQQGLTQEGSILGTFQYMAPEQLEGGEADARSDIFALGAVLYEMATGRKAFSGSSQASLISAIMKEDPPPVSTIQAMSPPALDRVVKTCLAKDPEDRWQSAHDVGNELKWIAEGSQAGVPAAVKAVRKNRERLAWVLAAAGLALAAILVAVRARHPAAAASVIRADLSLPPRLFVNDFKLSPDGRRLAFTMAPYFAGPPTLWIRDLDSGDMRPIPNAEVAHFPFWSADGRFVGFFAEGKLQSVNPSDGTLVKICDAPQGVGGTWNADGTIVFAPSGASALFRVAATGGKPEPVTKLDASRKEVAHRYPWFLPDGRRFLYLATDLGTEAKGESAIRVGSLDGKVDKAIVSAISNVEFAAGHVLYVRDTNLVAQPFDVERLAATGEPVTVAALLDKSSGWTAFYTFASSDRVILSSKAVVPVTRLGWYDRSGRPQSYVGEPGRYFSPRLSPDGRQVAVPIPNMAKDSGEIWVYDAASGAGSKFVFAPYWNVDPVWSADAKSLFFSSDRTSRGTRQDIWLRRFDGSAEQVFLETGEQLGPEDSSRDGRFLAIRKVPVHERNYQIWVVEAASKRQIPIATEAGDHYEPRLSPDGKWIAYQSDESGASEVYVKPLPGPGGKWKVSTSGGMSPRWRGDGRELFYATPDYKIVAVPILPGPGFQPGPPVVLFEKPNNGFDVAADGQRFLVNALPDDLGVQPLAMVVNWTALLKKPEPSR